MPLNATYDLALTFLNSPPYRIELTDEWDFKMFKDHCAATRKFLCLGGKLNMAYPHYGDFHPMNPSCKCVSNTLSPFPGSRTTARTAVSTGDPTSIELWVGGINNLCVITSYYTTDFLDIGDAPKKSMRVHGEMLTTGEDAHWLSDNAVAEGVMVAYPTSKIEISYQRKFEWSTWRNYLPLIVPMVGSTNNAAWTDPADGVVWPAYTLLFEGVNEESEMRLVDGMPYAVADITYLVSYWPGGVAGAWRTGTSTWDTVKEVDQAIAKTNFNDLRLI